MVDVTEVVAEFGEQPVWYVKVPPATCVSDGFEVWDAIELEAVVDYVLALTHRGELEQLLAAHASDEGELDEETAEQLAAVVTRRWKSAERDGVVAKLHAEPGDELRKELKGHVRKEIGALAVPDDLHFTNALPKTRPHRR